MRKIDMPKELTDEDFETIDSYSLLLVAWGKLARESSSYWMEGDVEQKEAHALLIDSELKSMLKKHPWLANIPSNLYDYSKGASI